MMPDIHRDVPIGEIVSHDIRTIDVFGRYGIDFCCGGRRTVNAACAAAGVDADHVLRELREVAGEPDPAVDLTTIAPERLIDRIVTRHHGYVRAHLPLLRGYLDQLAAKHGERRPEMARLALIFADVGDELIRHMEKEERLLFPAIRRLAGELSPASADDLARQIEPSLAVMEDEHEWAAAQLALMRTLACDYTPPPEACPTWRACYAALDRFERDLYQHVHLENNVLFPMARRLGTPLRMIA